MAEHSPRTNTRVLFPLAAHLTGGSTFSSLLLMSRLRSRGFEPIVALHGEGPIEDLAAGAGVVAYRSGVENLVGTQHPMRQGLDVARALPRIRTELDRHEVRLVHTNDARMHRLWGPAARSSGRGWIWHQRTPGLSRGMALLALAADDIITVSAYAQDRLPPKMRKRSRIIDNPFEQTERASLPDLRPEILASVHGNRPRFIVGLVSNLKARRKRPETFIRIAAGLKAGGLDGAYPIVGALSAARRHELEALAASLGVGDQVSFHGTQTPVDAWIAACDVIVAPALDEAFGRVLVEAAMLGVPVVAADDGGHREIIDAGRTGLLFAPDDLQAATRAVETLLADPELHRRIAEAALTSAGRRFSTDSHADAVTERYDAVLRTRRKLRV